MLSLLAGKDRKGPERVAFAPSFPCPGVRSASPCGAEPVQDCQCAQIGRVITDRTNSESVYELAVKLRTAGEPSCLKQGHFDATDDLCAANSNPRAEE